MKSLITGAKGQLGEYLLRALREAGDDVIATDIVEVDDPIWRILDVTDAQAVRAALAEHKPDRVFHLAAILSAKGERNPQATYTVNQGGTYNVLEACRLEGVSQLLYTSTIAVFGPGLPDPTPDAVELLPTTMYGVTKAAGEVLGTYYHRRYGLNFRGVRFPGVIGPSMPGGGTSDYALFMYVDAVRKGAYRAFCRPDTRIPLMYMPDAIRSLLELAAAPDERLTRSAMSPRAEEIAASVRSLVPDALLEFDPDPKRQAILDSWPKALDDSPARTDWNWKPAFDLDAMTNDLIPQIRAMVTA
jgi:threonine 3-dehydrogenase